MTWRAIISGSGVVSRQEGTQRISVPHGEYTMREIGSEQYEFSREGVQTFPLTVEEVAQYKENGTLKFPDDDWP